ncbi:MAG TPA: tetratricopeptide repeat protein [Pyrinomonadaceae bacterium]
MKSFRLFVFTLVFAILVTPILAQSQPQDSSEGLKILQTAFAQYKAGQYKEALANCAKVLAIDPKERRAYVLIGYVYADQDKLKEASDSVAKAIKIDPTDKEVHLLKAQYDYRRGANQDALPSVRKAIELDPNYADAYLMLGKVLEHRDQPKAVEAYQKAVSLNPQLFEVYAAMGEIYESQEQAKNAEEVYRKGIAADPFHMAGRFNLGRILLKQNRLAEAREIWEGRTSDEDNMRPTFIEELTRAENLKRATDAVAQKPDDPVALVDLGFATMEGDSWVVDFRQERAIVHFKKALDLKPDYARAQYGIVKAYIQLADVRPENNKKVDVELARLRKLDAKLAAEMAQYRKTYTGDLIAVPPFKAQ